MEPGTLLTGLMLAAIGAFSVVAAAMDWDFFINHYKARLIVSMLGRNGARVFYGVLGAVIAVMGVLIALGLVSGERKRQRFQIRGRSEIKIRKPSIAHRPHRA